MMNILKTGIILTMDDNDDYVMMITIMTMEFNDNGDDVGEGYYYDDGRP